ncbi:MAG: Two component transcriptional regulator, winged helix family [Candidatus Gottesmanbacteria bacterium GW2011_GWA1_43_11]|uniref:Two component transcriptional regulator, winged helix family n=1 Tax=Candidatus Gottesmanbacteria bacterium GW2011_GWA1_43_11 TaxID=1618436 RepID=A0A0G1CGD9_9BACT|nr:MAG: Two component transcriptional regulator, winged helix family [Candidatus Gottesmanbacteria bacterium GW2011_GWA1_43_11]
MIEDDHRIATAVKKGLEQEAFAVDVAFDGEVGFDLASTETFDVIILDLMLPKLDGISLTKKLRAENIHTPILMLTAKGQVDDKVAGLNSGADDYLAKPFAFTELLARIRAMSRRPTSRIAEILTVADLELNTINYEVKRNGKLITLSRKEFALLEFLLRHVNTIVTKDQIMNHVWEYDADILPNTVEVYIGYLRNRIDKPFATQLIRTVRGFGYKIGV